MRVVYALSFFGLLHDTSQFFEDSALGFLVLYLNCL